MSDFSASLPGQGTVPRSSPAPSATDVVTSSPAALKVERDALVKGKKRAHDSILEQPTIRLGGEQGWFDQVTRGFRPKREISLVDHTKITGAPKMTDLAQVIYFLKHDINEADIDVLLKDVPDRTYEAKDTRRIIKASVSRWQTKILTTYLLPKVEPIYEAKLEESVDMLDISQSKRVRIWKKIWTEDALNISFRMWSPLTNVVDIHAMFNPPEDASPEKKRLMLEFKEYLGHCFLLAADSTLNWRIRAAKKPDTMGSTIIDIHKTKPITALANQWRTMTVGEHLRVHDVPICPGREVTENKKPRVKPDNGADTEKSKLSNWVVGGDENDSDDDDGDAFHDATEQSCL